MKAKVLSTNRRSDEYLSTIGLIGDVVWQGQSAVSGRRGYGLRFEGIKNPSSVNGRFYYYPDQIELLEEEEMKEFDWNEYKVAECLRPGVAETQSFAIAKADIEKGKDFIKPYGITETNEVLHILRAVEISEVSDYAIPVPKAELKAAFDMAPYEARLARRAKKAKLKKQMDARVKEIQSTQLYELLAKDDKTLADLLKEYAEV